MTSELTQLLNVIIIYRWVEMVIDSKGHQNFYSHLSFQPATMPANLEWHCCELNNITVYPQIFKRKKPALLIKANPKKKKTKPKI